MELIDKSLIHFCEYQDRCHQEVRDKLYSLGYNPERVEEQIAYLIQHNLINEERFARSYARGKFRIKQWGKLKIVQHLKQKKISDFCIKKGLQEIDTEDYDHTLNMLADKKMAELKSEKNPFTKRGKLYRHLLQKGYEADLIIDIIKERIK